MIYDAVGTRDFAGVRRFLTKNGLYLTLVPAPGIDFFVPGQTERVPGKGYFVAWTPTAADLDMLAGWVNQGAMKPVLDSVWPLSDVQKAHARSETLHAVGKIVLRVR